MFHSDSCHQFHRGGSASCGKRVCGVVVGSVNVAMGTAAAMLLHRGGRCGLAFLITTFSGLEEPFLLKVGFQTSYLGGNEAGEDRAVGT